MPHSVEMPAPVNTTARRASTRLATLALATADDSGSSQTDAITNKTSALTITGKADAGTVVELLDGATSLGTVTAATDGTFTKEELCVNPPYEGGRRNGQRPHNHDVKPVPADTLDGKYCTACYERMRRSEAKANAAA